MEKEKYLAELEALLGFMSSWDREAEIKKYAHLFDSSPDAEKLIEQLGTPTKVAVHLARGYAPSPPPERGRAWEPEVEVIPADGDLFSAEETPEPSGDEAGDEAGAEAAAEAAAPQEALPEEPEKQGPGAGAIIGFLLFTIVVGVPVTVVLLCVGVPFIAAGAALVAAMLQVLFPVFSSFSLFSDRLVLMGAGVALLAVSLLLCWLGLWISISLARLWILRAVVALGKRLLRGKEAETA